MRVVQKRRKALTVLTLITISYILSGCQSPPKNLAIMNEGRPVSEATSSDKMLPLAQISESTPEHFESIFPDPNFNWSINAQVILPEDLQRFDVISCGIGEEPDFRAVLASDIIPEALRQTGPFEGEAMNFITATPVSPQRRLVATEEGRLFDLLCALGQLTYYHAVPEKYLSDNPSFSTEILSRDGVAQSCELTGDEAQAKVLEFLDALPLPYKYSTGQILAISPDSGTSLVRGYYQIQVQQHIDEKPVTVFNGASQISWGGVVDSNFIPSQLGGYVRVFDYGVNEANLRWLSDSFQVVQSVDKILPLSAAVEIVSDLLKSMSDKGPLGNLARASYTSLDRGMTIESIRLEYAAKRCEKDKVVLTPCWSFEGMGIAPYFYGIRIDALTGEVLVAFGEN